MRNLAQMSCDLNIAVEFVQCEQASELFMSPYNDAFYLDPVKQTNRENLYTHSFMRNVSGIFTA